MGDLSINCIHLNCYKLKVAIIIPNISRNGPIIYVEYLVESLVQIGVKVDVFCFENVDNIKGLDVKIRSVKFLDSVNFDEYDIVHSHTIKADLFALKHFYYIRNKWVLTTHNLFKVDLSLLYNPYKSFLISFIWSIAFYYCRNIIVFSRSMKEYYIKEIGLKNYGIIRTGVPVPLVKNIDEDDFEKLINLKKSYSIVGSSGHLIKRKGFHQLVSFLSMNLSCAVVIMGQGKERESLIKQANDLGVRDRLLLLGFKSDAVSYYKYFDLFILPSYAEGLPLALLEAMAVGLPIVCSRLDNYKDHFLEDDVSFFNLDDIESLTKSVAITLKNKELFAERSKRLYVQKFSTAKMAQIHYEYYIKIKLNENEK